jgi:hypothetical protein
LKNRFWEPPCPEKITIVSVIEGTSFQRLQDSTIFRNFANQVNKKPRSLKETPVHFS